MTLSRIPDPPTDLRAACTPADAAERVALIERACISLRQIDDLFEKVETWNRANPEFTPIDIDEDGELGRMRAYYTGVIELGRD